MACGRLINAASAAAGLQVSFRTSAFRFSRRGLGYRQLAGSIEVADHRRGRSADRHRMRRRTGQRGKRLSVMVRALRRQMAYVFEIQDEIVASILKAVVPACWAMPSGRGAIHGEHELTSCISRDGITGTSDRHPRCALPSKASSRRSNRSRVCAGLCRSRGLLRNPARVRLDFGRGGPPKAQAAMTKAMTLAPDSWEANFSHAFYWFYFERDWRQAELHFQKAVAINPRSSLAQAYYAIFLSIPRHEGDAVSHAALACQLDPYRPTSARRCGRVNARSFRRRGARGPAGAGTSTRLSVRSVATWNRTVRSRAP